jgi:hypothetical protein
VRGRPVVGGEKSGQWGELLMVGVGRGRRPMGGVRGWERSLVRQVAWFRFRTELACTCTLDRRSSPLWEVCGLCLEAVWEINDWWVTCTSLPCRIKALTWLNLQNLKCYGKHWWF